MGVARRDVTPAFLALTAALPPSSRHKRAPAGERSGAARSAFDAEAAELTQSLATMEALLREVRPRYLRPKLTVRVKGARMDEREKDAFDADFTELVRNCSEKIDALNGDVARNASRASVTRVEHQKEVVTYLLERLKSIANATKRMQKRRFDQPFLLSSRLLPEEVRAELSTLEDKLPKSPAAPAQKTAPDAPPGSKPEQPSEKSAATTVTPPPRAPAKPAAITHTAVLASQSDEMEFTEEQDRRFRAENLLLHRHFQENLEDAKSMESKMAEISSLMGQFSEKIMEQQSDLEMIHQHAKETNANVKQSNRILEQTQNIGSGYGFMIFCIYVGFSFVLHALHYFNS